MADKYNVSGMMEVFRCFMIAKMTAKNVYQAAILGHQCNDEILRGAAMHKLVRSGKSVKEIQGWRELKKHPELALEVLEFYSQSMKSGSCKPPPAKRCRSRWEPEREGSPDSPPWSPTHPVYVQLPDD